MNRNTLNWIILGTCVASFSAGCSHDKQCSTPYMHGEKLTAETPREESRFFDLQIAKGARADATVRSIHFDGDCLNSLGKAKLDNVLMAGDSCDVLTIYLDLHKDDPTLAKRKGAVIDYLKDKGLTEDQIALETGPNLKFSAPAAPSVKALDAMDSSAGSFSAGDVAAGGAAGAAH